MIINIFLSKGDAHHPPLSKIFISLSPPKFQFFLFFFNYPHYAYRLRGVKIRKKELKFRFIGIRYMKYAFLFTTNAFHFSITNKFYFYYL